MFLSYHLLLFIYFFKYNDSIFPFRSQLIFSKIQDKDIKKIFHVFILIFNSFIVFTMIYSIIKGLSFSTSAFLKNIIQ